jgi:hypothetical protein
LLATSSPPLQSWAAANLEFMGAMLQREGQVSWLRC